MLNIFHIIFMMFFDVLINAIYGLSFAHLFSYSYEKCNWFDGD